MGSSGVAACILLRANLAATPQWVVVEKTLTPRWRQAGVVPKSRPRLSHFTIGASSINNKTLRETNMGNNINSYQQTLDDLELRKTRCLEDLRKIEAAITGLRAAMEVAVNRARETVVVHIATPSEARQAARQRYANMSVRWAILKFLYEHSMQPQKTADISAALLEGGNEKASKATVSAVISAMNKKNEIMSDADNQGYKLTIAGRSAWGAIVNNSKYINRVSSAADQ